MVLPAVGPDYRMPSKLFNIHSGGSLVHEIGGGIDRALEPITLIPTRVFYDSIRTKAEALGFAGKKFPLTITSDSNSISSRVNIKFRQFGSRTIVLTVKLDPIEISVTSFTVTTIPNIGNLPNLLQFIKLVLSLIISGDHKTLANAGDPKLYPCVAVILEKHASPISDKDAVRFLTRHSDVNDNLVASVIGKNLNHQVGHNSLLLDRQGIFLRATFEGDISGSLRRFRSALGILELIVGIESIVRLRDYLKIYQYTLI